MRTALLAFMVAAGCSGGDRPSTTVDASDGAPAERDPRFVGLWAVEQPFHALYERTFYRLDADGAVVVGSSEPADCSGHLERHCVTGSVARCLPSPTDESCRGTPTCVFGARWRSAGPRTLIIDGVCDDGVARPITVELDDTPADDRAGSPAAVITVGGEAGWSHDNWTWSFRKCPTGTTTADCAPGL